VSLPHLYPFQLPNISVYSSQLSRSGHDSIKYSLKAYLDGIEAGTLYIILAVEWVLENFSIHNTTETRALVIRSIETKKFSRLWIHSHHIYSKNKIKSIEDWANELNLSGFILAGKPGFVCVEGTEENCQMWWQRVRSMNWQKISCKLKEDTEEEALWKKFSHFTNITHIRDSHQSDMKAFLLFLEEHASYYVFKEYFGFDGK